MIKFKKKTEEFKKENENLSKVRVGTAIIRQLSTTFYPNVRMVFEELVANASDAMAKTVKIHIGEDKITVEDNGIGMSRDQLVKFFYISHTEKEEGSVKTRGNIKKRAILGKFGIGKLTLYRICKTFEITTWHGGNASRATFNFGELEKNDFIDEFELKVEPTEDIFETPSGTKITLFKLKEHINTKEIKRYLQRTMPLTPDFEVTIGGVGMASPVLLRSEDLIGDAQIYKIPDDVNEVLDDRKKIPIEILDLVGPITGRIAFLEHGRKESGIYIRVLGRIVNHDHPNDIIDFYDLSHPRLFERRIMAEIHADGLNDILLTNRSDFIRDSDKWKSFTILLKKILQYCMDEEFEKHQQEAKKFEVETIPKVAADFIRTSIASSRRSDKIMTALKKKVPKAKTKVKKLESKASRSGPKPSITLEGINLGMSMKPLGEFLPEAIFDRRKQEIVINSDHPMYIIARKQGKRWGALYHSIKASIVLVALEVARNLQEFKELYDSMLFEAPEKLKEVKLRRRRKKKQKNE